MGVIVGVHFIDVDGMVDRKAQRDQLNRLARALDAFERVYGRYPRTAEGLGVLWDRGRLASAEDAGRWVVFLDEGAGEDPWGHPLVYESSHADCAGKGFIVRSPGPDGRIGTSDDLALRRCEETSSGS